ncbi:hypothetical protein HF086_002112 [Spodoptera exigua]|uniref:Uncharacterized protein n=1 Tax=Spodoptera exigua TaxID=7107 RepID=A0A922SJI8_SPOEX|nr:hypothetical protein HF086_002112 [Spodoptera exigua]
MQCVRPLAASARGKCNEAIPLVLEYFSILNLVRRPCDQIQIPIATPIVMSQDSVLYEELVNQCSTGPPPRLGLKAASPGVAGADEDCNSNTSLTGSQHSHDDIDAHCDNSGYLWFLDYNPIFRDGSCHHTSVLSSVSASYKGISDLTSRFEFTSRYNDIARDLDANLAEADMESFRTEDIHALLMTANLPHDTIIDDRTHDVSINFSQLAIIEILILLMVGKY